MTHHLSNAAVDLSYTGNLSQGTNGPSQHPSTLVHLLDDDCLLIVFSFCRLAVLDEGVAYTYQLLEGGEWNRERWWHRLTRVCRRWRYLVLESAFHLQVSLVCAPRTPVADMLAHSPPLPLIIDYIDDNYHVLTPEDEEGIILALHHRNLVRRIRIRKSVLILQKLVIALDGDFPILEFLLIDHQRYHEPLIDHITNLNLPETFRAPNLCGLLLENFTTPIESPLLSTMGSLVTLVLAKIPSSAYFHPNALLQRLSLMPQLETLGISFNCYNPGLDAERNLWHTPVILPNLRWLMFGGTSAYLEALLPWVTIPLLERLYVQFFNQMMYSTPHLQQVTSTARNLRLKTATVSFDGDCLGVTAFPNKGTSLFTLSISLDGRHLDWQVVSGAQVFYALRTVFSTVEDLTLEYDRHNMPWEWNRQADRSYWRELLGSFGKVKTLRVEDGLVEQVSRALEPGEGESLMELFPELQGLSYSIKGAFRAFTLFIDARQKAGRPVTVARFF